MSFFLQQSHTTSSEVEEILVDEDQPEIGSPISTVSTNDTDNIDLDDIPLMELLFNIERSDEDIAMSTHGYARVADICDTLQGELIKARVISSACKRAKIGDVVAIKKVAKDVYEQHIAVKQVDDDASDGFESMKFCVAEDIVKEACILQYLQKHRPIGAHTVKCVDFFETECDFFLVLEYIDGITLKEFVRRAHELIAVESLCEDDYRKTIKYIFWQLIVTLHSLHTLFRVCHLDLCLENVMLTNVGFVRQSDGSYTVDHRVTVKLIDFGVAEVFPSDNGSQLQTGFECQKSGLSIDENALSSSPQAYIGDLYDARANDMWALGMMYYQCVTNQSLLSAEKLWMVSDYEQYFASLERNLQRHIFANNLGRFFRKKSLQFLCDLLRNDEVLRLSASVAMLHPYFKCYYQSYKVSIAKRSASIQARLEKARESGKMNHFPFYDVDRDV